MGLPVCLFLLRSVSSFLSKFKYIDGSYYPWTYSHKEHARRTTCLYEIVSKIVLGCASLRKADAKVVLMHIPTKQIGKYFLEYFVNKYNSLKIIGLNLRGLKGDSKFVPVIISM